MMGRAVMALGVLPIVFLSAEEAMIPKNFAVGGGSHGVSLLPRVQYAASRPNHSIA